MRLKGGSPGLTASQTALEKPRHMIRSLKLCDHTYHSMITAQKDTAILILQHLFVLILTHRHIECPCISCLPCPKDLAT
jgi:hypothetical protein